MGEVIRSRGAPGRRAQRRTRDDGVAPARAQFFFDLACPFTYLAAERVERAFDARDLDAGVSATVSSAAALADDPEGVGPRARAPPSGAPPALRLPLVWPETLPAPT